MYTTDKAVCPNKICESQNTNSSVAITLKQLEITSQCLDCGTEWVEYFESTHNGHVTQQGTHPNVVRFKVVEVDDLCADIQHTDYFISSLRLALSKIEFCLNRQQTNLHSHKSADDPNWDFTGIQWYQNEGGNDTQLESTLSKWINHKLLEITKSLYNFKVTIVDGCDTGAYLKLSEPYVKGDLVILVETSITCDPCSITGEEPFSLFDWMDLIPAVNEYSYESLLTIPMLTKYFPLEIAISLRKKAKVVLAEYFTDGFSEEFGVSYELADSFINDHQGVFLQHDGYWVLNSLDLIGSNTEEQIQKYQDNY